MDLAGDEDRRTAAPHHFVGPKTLYAAVFVGFLLLYGLTTQRGPSWQDSGIFQWRIHTLDLNGWLGLALSHPLLILLGKVFGLLPFGPPAWRLNLVSAAFGAFAVANVVLLVWRLTPHRPVAWIVAGGLFAFSHTLWWLATICESQVILVGWFTLELHLLLSLVRRPRAATAALLGLVNGVGWSTHNLALLATPAYAIVALLLCSGGLLRRRALLYAAGGWLVGAGGMLGLILSESSRTGLGAAFHSALFGQSWRGAVFAVRPKTFAMGAGYILYNFPNLGLPLMAIGLWSLRKRLPGLLGAALLYLTLVYFLFPIRYSVPDQFMFFLPFYAMVSILAGVGLGGLKRTVRSRWLGALALAGVAVTPMVYLAAPAVWRCLALPLPGRKDLPFRDPGRYWLQPWKGGEDSAGRFARTALEQVPDGSVIVADGTSRPALRWVQDVEQQNQGVTILAAAQATPENVPVGRENVFVVSARPGYCPKWIREAADLRKDGERDVLFRVAWRTGF